MRLNVFAVLLTLCIVFALPLAAQEVTEVSPTGETTVEGVVSGEDTVTVTIETPESDALPALLNIVVVFIGAIVAGGSFAVIWDRIRRSKEAKDSIERLAEGLSPTWKSTIDRILDVAEQVNKTAGEVLQFAREVTDGAPNQPPPTG